MSYLFLLRAFSYICFFFARYLPSFYSDHCAVVLTKDETKSEEKVGPYGCSPLPHPALRALQEPQRRRLDLAAWLAAWDGFAVAAAVVGCLTMVGASKHKRHVQWLCENAVREGRRELFGVLYDELARSAYVVRLKMKHGRKQLCK